jgi:hypothetical protein
VKLPEALPVDVALKIPQKNLPALVAFGLLAAFLVLVGRGWVLKGRTNGAGISPIKLVT